MLYVIPHIQKDAKNHSDSDHRKQVNNVIKTLFHGLPEEKMAVTQDILWTEYNEFDNKISSFDADEFICKSKTSEMVTVICGIKNIHFLSPRFSVLLHVESHQRFLLLVQQSVHGVM